MDVCLYVSQNFGFISFPDELTTGSSIMPHKKNPDVFELIRAYCNRLKALPNEIFLMTTNLPSGYHRDMQLLKERLFPAFQTLRSCFNIAAFMVQNIQINSNILNDEKYKYLFTVDAINELVKQGVPFRDAYKQIGMQVQNNTFKPASLEAFTTTHEGSIGNLCNEEIMKAMQKTIESFQFAKVHTALEALLR
jgi:argininosuccinate lyase